MTDMIDRARRCMIAGVWLFHGVGNKLLGLSPRHLKIIEAVLGIHGAMAISALWLIGLGETAIAIWVLSGKRRISSAICQSIVLLTMNCMELTWARQYLLWPAALLPANAMFLALVWWNAKTFRSREREAIR